MHRSEQTASVRGMSDTSLEQSWGRQSDVCSGKSPWEPGHQQNRQKHRAVNSAILIKYWSFCWFLHKNAVFLHLEHVFVCIKAAEPSQWQKPPMVSLQRPSISTSEKAFGESPTSCGAWTQPVQVSGKSFCHVSSLSSLGFCELIWILALSTFKKRVFFSAYMFIMFFGLLYWLVCTMCH